MAKREYVASLQSRPCGETGIAEIRAIVANRQFRKVKETAVDAFTASAVIAVYDALNTENKAKLVGFPVYKVCDIALKLLAKQRGK